MSVVLYPCISCVNGYVCLGVCELFNQQFAIYFGVVVLLLLNVMEVFSVG